MGLNNNVITNGAVVINSIIVFIDPIVLSDTFSYINNCFVVPYIITIDTKYPIVINRKNNVEIILHSSLKLKFSLYEHVSF